MEKKKRNLKLGWLYSAGRFVLRLIFPLVYRLKVEGAENIPAEGPVLLCSNHVAIKDPIVLGVVLRRRVFYMAKAELFRNRFLNWLLRGLGAFPVERGTGGADALAEGYRLLSEGEMVGIFLEGHRSKDGRLQRPKTGASLLAYRTKAPVLPVCIAAQNGWRPKPFQRTIIRFGKPLTAEDLNIPDSSSLHLRRASRTIMEKIAALRNEAFIEMGLPTQPAPEMVKRREKPAAEKAG